MVDEFLRQYDDGSLSFPMVRFRDGADFTLPFGVFSRARGDFKKHLLAFSDRDLYFHFGVDRADGVIVLPFDAVVDFVQSVDGYGTLTRIFPVGADFEIRVAHMDRLADHVNDGGVNPAGMILGDCGTRGIGFGAHSHTELVAMGDKSEILEYILAEKSLDGGTMEYRELLDAFPANERNAAAAYMWPRRVTSWSDHKCTRRDGFLGGNRMVTYYDSQACFGF